MREGLRVVGGDGQQPLPPVARLIGLVGLGGSGGLHAAEGQERLAQARGVGGAPRHRLEDLPGLLAAAESALDPGEQQVAGQVPGLHGQGVAQGRDRLGDLAELDQAVC
ncbi:hypothetical protein D3C86_1664390 [compost metagenome]